MLLSSGVFEVGLEAGALLEHSPQDVDASAGECKNGLALVRSCGGGSRRPESHGR